MYYNHIVRNAIKKVWDWFKQPGNLISLFFLVFVFVFLFMFAIEGSLFGGSIDSARYLLSALAQTQGAIIAIVISLTIVAIQVSSQSYSLRVTDLLLKYEFFWFMLFLYGLSIIYDITLLNRINDSNIGDLYIEVNTTIFIATIVLWALFPYSKKTIERLRPQTIIRILGKNILSNERGTFTINRSEAIFPLFDSIKKAIRNDDIATARDGIGETERVCCEILTESLNEKDEKLVASTFCEQYQRTAKIAFIQNDIDSVLGISKSLERIANNIANNQLSKARADSLYSISEKLADIGMLAIDKRWEDVLGFVANSLGDLSVKCVEMKISDEYINDIDLQGVKVLSTDVIKNTANGILHFLSELNLQAMSMDVILAARNTKRPFSSACVRLIEKNLGIHFYQKMCAENIYPVVQSIQTLLGIRFDWIPHIAEILIDAGIESIESLGKGMLEKTFGDYLVWLVATKPSEQQQIIENDITRTMAMLFNTINGIENDAGVIWLLEVFERIGIEYNNKGNSLLSQKVIGHIGIIGSSLVWEKKSFAVEVAHKALDSIDSILKSRFNENLIEHALKEVLRIITETRDDESRTRATIIFQEIAKTRDKPAFKQIVENCINAFKFEYKIFLESSAEKKERLDQFINDLSSML